MVDDEELIGEIAREPCELLGLVWIEHQLEQLAVTRKHRDDASKLRLVSDSWPSRKASRRLGRMPAQHLPNADAAAHLRQAVEHRVCIRRGEFGVADIAHRHAG